MTDRKINSDTTDFTIPKRDTNPKTKDIVIKLAQRGKYDVYQKDFPSNLPKDEKYTWINNFGLKLRRNNNQTQGNTGDTTPEDPYEPTVDQYTIELDNVEGKTLVYFDGTSVQTFGRKNDVGRGRIQVTLNRGDPPIGWL